MRTVVIRNVLANLRTNRVQSLLILLVLTAATATLTLTLTVQRSAGDPWQRAFDKTNGAHIVLGFLRDTDHDLSRIGKLDSVSEVAGPFQIVWNHELAIGEQREPVVFVGSSPEPVAVGRPSIVKGRWLEAGDVSQIVLDWGFAREHGLNVGDRVQSLTSDGPLNLEIVGLAVNPSRGMYPDWQATHYVLPNTLSLIEPNTAVWGERLLVRLDNPDATSRFAMQAAALFPGDMLTMEDWQDVRDDITFWPRMSAVFLGIFSIIALIAAGFIIVNVIAGRVLNRYREIGLLKAIGFTPGQVTLIFMLEHLILGALAGIIGLAAGVAIAPLFLLDIADALNAPAVPVFDPLMLLLILAVVTSMTMLFTLLPAWLGGRIAAVDAITTGFVRVSSRRSLTGRLARGLHLPPAIVLGVKDAFSRPVRATLTVLALVLTIVTLTFAFSVEATIAAIVARPELEGDPYEIATLPTTLPETEIARILDTFPEIENYRTRRFFDARADASGGAPRFTAQAIGGEPDDAGYVIFEGRMFAAPGEAIVGHGLLKQLGVDIGDQIQLTLSESFTRDTQEVPLTLTIVGRYAETENGGRMAIFHRDTIDPLLRTPGANSYLINLGPGVNAAAVGNAINAKAGGELDLAVQSTGADDEVQTIQGIMLGLNSVLVLIAIVNLLAMTLLAVRERTRDIGIFKTIGLTPAQIVISVIAGASMLALLAVIIGVPIGMQISRLFFDNIGVGNFDFDSALYQSPPLLWLVLLVPFAIVIAAASSVIPARFAARIQVTEALRYQ